MKNDSMTPAAVFPGHHGKEWVRIAAGIFFGIFYTTGILLAAGSAGEGSDTISLGRCLRTTCDKCIGARHGTLIAIVIRFENFNCLPCLNDFMRFSDSLRGTAFFRNGGPVVLLIARNEQPRRQQEVSMKRWAKENNLPYPVICISRDPLERWHIDRSTLFIIDPADFVTYSATIPFSDQARLGVLSHIGQESK